MPFLVAFAVACAVFIVGTIIGVIVMKARKKPFDLGTVANYSSFAAVVACITMLCFMGGYTENNATYSVNRSYELASMRDANTQTGSFIIGTGSTSSEMMLNYYIVNDDGGMRPDSIRGIKATIYEVAEGPYRVEVLDAECTESILCYGYTVRTAYAFYVPKGSVLTYFKLDAE